MQSETKKQSVMGTWSGSAVVVCLALMLGFASTGYGDIILGNWENQMDGWAVVDATAADPCEGVGNTLNNYSLKVAVPSGWHMAVDRESGLLPDIATATVIKVDITLKASEWVIGSGWVKAIENIVLQDDMSSWQQLGPVGGDSAVSWDGASDQTFTAVFNVPAQTGPITWAFLVIVTNYDGVTTPGNFYFDNVRIVTPAMTVSKCKVTAGKTQYHGDEDYNDMKDTFEASGTVSLPADLNDINSVDVAINSVTDDEVIYTETLDFNTALVRSGKFNYTHGVLKGRPGAIMYLFFDFNRGTFKIKAKNIDLTGLASPLEVKFTMGSYELSGQSSEVVINGTKTIPTRLMRLYNDKLVVTRARAKNSTRVLSDTLSVKGEIAVADMNVDANEPNLVNEDVVITWGDVNDTNTQTFTIPAGSFTASKKGHTYKCSKVVADANDGNEGVVTATIDLDKCTFTVSVKNATGLYADKLGAAVFGIRFETPNGEFNEEDNYTLP